MSISEGIQAFNTREAARSYGIASLSIGYQTSIRAIVEKGLVPFFNNKTQPISILETGSGQGKSAWATKQLLRSLGINNVEFITTEKSGEQIIKSIKPPRKILSFTVKKDEKIIHPKIQSDAEILPFANESVDAHMSSQVDHWIVPKESLLKSYVEAARVLKQGGLFVHAVSGLVDLGIYNKYHFTRSPFYQYAYLPLVEKSLIENGLWDKSQGEFVPWNQNVNPFYYNYTLDRSQENGLPALLEKAGFKDIKVDTYMACLNANEMETRMTSLSMINMHIFQGPYSKNINERIKTRIVKQAFNKARKNRPDLWKQLTSQPNEIIDGMPQDLVYGEPVPVITAKKK